MAVLCAGRRHCPVSPTDLQCGAGDDHPWPAVSILPIENHSGVDRKVIVMAGACGAIRGADLTHHARRGGALGCGGLQSSPWPSCRSATARSVQSSSPRRSLGGCSPSRCSSTSPADVRSCHPPPGQGSARARHAEGAARVERFSPTAARFPGPWQPNTSAEKAAIRGMEAVCHAQSGGGPHLVGQPAEPGQDGTFVSGPPPLALDGKLQRHHLVPRIRFHIHPRENTTALAPVLSGGTCGGRRFYPARLVRVGWHRG